MAGVQAVHAVPKEVRFGRCLAAKRGISVKRGPLNPLIRISPTGRPYIETEDLVNRVLGWANKENPLSNEDKTELLPQEVVIVACEHQGVKLWPLGCHDVHIEGGVQNETYTRVSKSAESISALKGVLDFCETPERLAPGMRYMRSRDDIVTELRRRISALEGQNVSSFNAEVTAGCRAKSEYSGTPESGFDSRLVHHASSTPAESVTHPDATTEWISPHSPSDCQVTCPVHLRWADEVEAYMGPDYIRTRALEEAAKVADEWMRLARQRQNIATVIKDVQGRDIENVVANTSAQIAIAIRALPPPTPQPATSTPCPDCEQASATNDEPGFYLDNCEKHRDPAAPITVPSEMTKEEMQHEANFLKLQEMLSGGAIIRLEYERGLEQNDAEFRATLPAPTAQGDTVPAEEK